MSREDRFTWNGEDDLMVEDYEAAELHALATLVEWPGTEHAVGMRLVQEMALCNGCKFIVRPEQGALLAAGLNSMVASGFVFTEQVVEELVDGDAGENLAKYGTVPGWKVVDATLADIFNGGATC